MRWSRHVERQCGVVTSSTLNPARDAIRLTSWPASPSRRCRESAPRWRLMTSSMRPPSARRDSQVVRSWSIAALPIRIGGFDQISLNRCSLGTDSGAITVMLSPRRRAFSAVRVLARSFTSNAQTFADGDRSARERAIGPDPQPRSQIDPVDAGTTPHRNSSDVPVSRWP